MLCHGTRGCEDRGLRCVHGKREHRLPHLLSRRDDAGRFSTLSVSTNSNPLSRRVSYHPPSLPILPLAHMACLSPPSLCPFSPFAYRVVPQPIPHRILLHPRCLSSYSHHTIRACSPSCIARSTPCVVPFTLPLRLLNPHHPRVVVLRRLWVGSSELRRLALPSATSPLYAPSYLSGW